MAPAENPPARGPMTDEERWAVLDPWGQAEHLERVQAGDVELRLGDRVLLRPGSGADILDMALAGKVGVIQAIEQSFDDEYQIAVVLEDDPGRDLGELRQPGHRFFFRLAEVEPLPRENPKENPEEYQ
jgi:hypothetical protein